MSPEMSRPDAKRFPLFAEQLGFFTARPERKCMRLAWKGFHFKALFLQVVLAVSF
jgi:hypothetical protein